MIRYLIFSVVIIENIMYRVVIMYSMVYIKKHVQQKAEYTQLLLLMMEYTQLIFHLHLKVVHNALLLMFIPLLLER